MNILSNKLAQHQLNLYNARNNNSKINVNNNNQVSFSENNNQRSLTYGNFIVTAPMLLNNSYLNTAESKMVGYINSYLQNYINLKPNQPLKIVTDKSNMPFVKLLTREAYKMGSGYVIVDVKDPVLDSYSVNKNSNWITARDNKLALSGGVEIDLSKPNLSYVLSGLTGEEMGAIQSAYFVNLPQELERKLEVNAKEIIVDKLHLEKGQPLFISGNREHEKNIHAIVDFAYRYGAGPIEVKINEDGRNNLERSFLEYGKEELLKNPPSWVVDRYKEFISKRTARLVLEGDDPDELKGVNPDRITLKNSKYSEALKFFHEDRSTPWLIYYIPTTKSALSAYPEAGNNPLIALNMAADDAKKINRVGDTKHIEQLKSFASKINKLNLDAVHFISRDRNPITGVPKTDLTVGLSKGIKGISKGSVFIGAESGTVPYNQRYVANCPTEEVFTSPDRTKTRGHVTTTLPLSLNGNIVKDLYVEFDNTGNIIIPNIKASDNLDIFKKHVEKHKGATMLGELALVADSPIFHLGRIFNNTLIDENAACHIAIGKAYTECLDGSEKISPKEVKDFEESSKINHDATTHIDFMIGSPDVYVEGLRYEPNGSLTKIPLIMNNKFQNFDSYIKK